MTAPGPQHDTVGPLDVLMLVAEIACYVAVGMAAWRWHPAAAVAVVLVHAVWWGLLHSPKARYRLARPADLALRVVWFSLGAGASVWLLTR